MDGEAPVPTSESAGSSSARVLISDPALPAIAATLFAVLCVFGTFAGRSPGQAIFTPLVIALDVAGALVVIRYTTMRLSMDSTGLQLTQLPHRTNIPWNQLAEVRVVPGNNITGMTYCVGLELRSGSTVRCYCIQGYGEQNKRVVAAVEAIRSRWAFETGISSAS